MGNMRIRSKADLVLALDALAHAVDPYEYADRSDGAELASLGKTMDDLAAGDTAPYLEWLDGIGEDLLEAVGSDAVELAAEVSSALLAINAGALA